MKPLVEGGTHYFSILSFCPLTALERLEDLLEHIEYCPDSLLVPLWRKEAEEIQAIFEEYRI